MKHYIDKDIIVAEIKEYIDYYNKGYANGDNYKVDMLKTLLHDIDFFGGKVVDLEKEAENFVQTEKFVKNESPVLAIAKYFFELGLKAQKGE